MRFLLLAVLLGLTISQVQAQECFGLSCSTCISTQGCGFCRTSDSSFQCVRLVQLTVGVEPTCPSPTLSALVERITNVNNCPTTTNPCANNPCTSGTLTKCVLAIGQTPPYVCVDPCVGFLCPSNQKCSSATGTPTCVPACGNNPACSGQTPYCVCSTAAECSCFPTPCGNRCTYLTGSQCNNDLATCQCPAGTVPVQSVTGGASCVTPRINPCENFTCPYYGQVCVVSQSDGATPAAHCVCPDGTSLELSQSSTVNPDGTQTGFYACRPNPCSSVVCPIHRHCVKTVNAETGHFTTICVCDAGYTLSGDLCVNATACTPPLVADQATGLCVQKCWDQSAPINNRCPPVVCPDGTVINPFTLVGCGVICADGSWAPSFLRCPCLLSWIVPRIPNVPFRRCCNSSRWEIPDKDSTFPGTAAAPVNQLCVRCPCVNLAAGCLGYPVEGRCPGDACPAGWVLVNDPPRCKFICPGGALQDYPEQCPPPSCSPKVNDQLTRKCVDPCPDGSAPFNGFCPVVCPAGTSTYDCCIIKGGTNCVPPCPEGTVPLSNLDASCVPVCTNGYPRDPITGKCPEDDNGCPPGSFRPDNALPCKYPCPSRTTLATNTRFGATDINECCVSPARFDTLDLVCRCPDGRRAKDDGSCDHDCNPDTDVGCPCPKPLVRDTVTKKCACPAGTSLTAGGCQVDTIECPRGLVPSGVSRACVCPDGNQPVQDRCPCNPAADKDCPVTIFNCNWAGVTETFARCKCLLASAAGIVDPMCLPSAQTGSDDTVTIDFCRANPARAVCFCVLHPDAPDCKRPHPCKDEVYATEHKCECDPTSCSNPCVPGNPDFHCPIEKYCSIPANAQLPRCICFLNPKKCSYIDPPVDPSECTEAQQNDATNKRCYCHFHTDAACFNSEGEGQADRGGDTGGTITAPNTCVDNNDPTCQKLPPRVDEGSDDTSVNMRDRRSGGDVHDDVNVTIGVRPGRCGDIVFVREATAVVASADINDVSTYFRLVLSTVVEFGDANDNGKLDDGDDIRRKLDVSSLTCLIKTTSSTFNGSTCYTVAVFDTTGVLTFTFTVCSSALTIGTRIVPPRSAFEILEIQWPYSAKDSKLALFFDAFALGVNDVFQWVSASSTLVLTGPTGFNKGSLTFDLHARSGDNNAIPLDFQLQKVPVLSTVSALATEHTAFRLIVSVDAFAPYPLVIDPVYSAGNQPSTVGQSAASVVAFSFVATILSIALSLAL